MYIEFMSKDELIRPLQIITGIVERKQSMPILSNVLIEINGHVIYFTATDLDIQTATNIFLNEFNENDESFTVAAKKFLDILRILPDKSKVSLTTSESRLLIRCGKSRFNLQTLPAIDYPRISEQICENVTSIVLTQNDLKKLLSSVHYAMAQQDVRYYLNGILLVAENNTLKAVATDGHRLTYNSTEIQHNTVKHDVIIPRKTIIELLKLLNDVDDFVELIFFPQQIKIIFSGITIISKIIEGKFPDFKRVIPEYSNHLQLDRALIQQALQRTAILSNDKIHGIRFVLTEKKLSIVSCNNELEEAQDDIDVEYHNEALDIGFNVNYLLEGLSNMKGNLVTFSFGDPNSSILITISDDANLRYVVMPMRI